LEKNRPFRHEYLIAEDEMGDSPAQTVLLGYLYDVLTYLYRDAGWFVARNLTFLHPAIQNSQNMISPDIAVFVGLVVEERELDELASWEMRPEQARAHGQPVRPAPTVVFEVASKSTWETDIAEGEENKPWLYGRMGVREYFAYDPNTPPVWRGGPRPRQRVAQRLLGWRYAEAGVPLPLVPDERGWLWSEALESWLRPDGRLLRLCDQAGALRLTAAEAATALAEREHRARLEAEQRSAALEAELRRLRGSDQ
jgi:Uma2 family endonuclease